jgi:hypothetical protein
MDNVTTISRKFATAESKVMAWFAVRATATGRDILKSARAKFAKISVDNGGGTAPFLLTRQADVVKLSHNAHITDWEQVVTYLAAERSSGVANLCPWATPQCVSGCLQTSGHLGMSNGQIAMKSRTEFLVSFPVEFLICLIDETERHAKRIAKCGKKMAQRLNGTSDIPWERNEWIMAVLRSVGVSQHFDYTKGARRISTNSYYLAHSVTERTNVNDVKPLAVMIIDTPRNSAMPTTWNGMPVIDGDHANGDLRFLDPALNSDAVVCLRPKGKLQGAIGSLDSFVKPSIV